MYACRLGTTTRDALPSSRAGGPRVHRALLCIALYSFGASAQLSSIGFDAVQWSSSSSSSSSLPAANASTIVPVPLRRPIKTCARSRTAACRTAKTARHPAIAASRTASSISKLGSRASHCERTNVPRWGSIAHGRLTGWLPCRVDSSDRLRSTSGVSTAAASPALQAQRTSFVGIPASISAAEAALMAAQSRPPSSARTTTVTTIRDFGCRCNRIVASRARWRCWAISTSRRSVPGLTTRRSVDAKGLARTETSTTARSGRSSERLRHARGPATVARATVRPISTRALPPPPTEACCCAKTGVVVVPTGPSWTLIRRISWGLRPSFRRFERASRSVRRIDDPIAASSCVRAGQRIVTAGGGGGGCCCVPAVDGRGRRR
mmetsp:Transcript_19357/g.45015  ORF Transcript_19357/g.45015 Transcript_19357/m.45015 type:complete len:379 (-) Transcript_19357:1597-2733(-)